MTTIDLLARILIGWLVISTVVVGAYALVMARHNARRADVVRRPHYPPPVPAPVKPIDTDDCWLTVWPSDVERSDIDDMEQAVYDRLFDDLIAIEGLQ